MSVVTKGPWILPDLFVIYDFVKKKIMKERERKRESKKCPFLFYPVSVNLYKVNMNAEKNYKYAF